MDKALAHLARKKFGATIFLSCLVAWLAKDTEYTGWAIIGLSILGLAFLWIQYLSTKGKVIK